MHVTSWCHYGHVFLLSCVLLQASKGISHFSLRVLEPFMHHTWLCMRSQTCSHQRDHAPLYAYLKPMQIINTPLLLLGHVLITMWGLVKTSYREDHLNVGESSTINTYGRRRRVRWQVKPLMSIINLCTHLTTSPKIITSTCFSRHTNLKCWWGLLMTCKIWNSMAREKLSYLSTPLIFLISTWSIISTMNMLAIDCSVSRSRGT